MTADLPAPPPSLADPERLDGVAPALHYDVISNGRIERLMPPWRQSMSVQERWDVLAGAWSMAYDPLVMASARESYERSCSSCHGTDGPQDVPRLLGSGGLPGAYAERSHAELLAMIDELAAHRDLGPDAVQGAVRHLRFDGWNTPIADGLATGARISGRVVNATAGEETVAGTTIVARPLLRNGFGDALTTTVSSEGRFELPELMAGPGLTWTLQATYEGVAYPAGRPMPVALRDATDQVENVELAVHATTTEGRPGTLSVRSLVQPVPSEGRVEVIERWLLINGSDRTQIAPPGGSTVRLAIPPSARNLRFGNPEVGRGADVVDGIVSLTAPVPPGQREILVLYDVPYVGARLELPRVVPERVGEMIVLVADPDVVIESEGLPERSTAPMGDLSVPRVSARQVEAGSDVSVTIEGLPEAVTSGQVALAPLPPPPIGQEVLAGLAILTGLISLALAVSYPLWRDRGGAATRRRARAREAVLDRLGELEMAARAGEVAPNEYRRRRADLMEQAMALQDDAATE